MSMFFHGMAWGIVLMLLGKPWFDAAVEVFKNAWTQTKADADSHPHPHLNDKPPT